MFILSAVVNMKSYKTGLVQSTQKFMWNKEQ